ncbi:unnamed protein product [Cuscuta campestris]|uniref:Endonuclease/exonuclease/phosphatase domain-containing protein n=1 Tax=Cuscuta campestris TaxID=132261 RepID=A0A484K0K9_9ASTE|nr:unnamed protein product [Cuscuta campestris]
MEPIAATTIPTPAEIIEDLQITNNYSTKDLFPSLSEAKAYAKRRIAPRSPRNSFRHIPSSLDDCLHSCPDIGLGILLDSLENHKISGEAQFQFGLISLTKANRVDFVAILEPMAKEHKVNSVRMSLGVSNCATALNNKLWVFWRGDRLILTQVQEFTQMYTCHFWDSNLNTKWSITSVYGKHTGIQRRELWSDLINNIIKDHFWIVGGDFNAISSLDEHKGATTPSLVDLNEFKDCTEAIPLLSPPFSGGIFTWSGVRSRGKIWRRLDRALVNTCTMNFFTEINIKHCSKASSDHKALILLCTIDNYTGAKPFRSQDFWFNHHCFFRVVKEYWVNQPMTGEMKGLATKLRGLKPILKAWSKETFRDIFQAVKDAESKAMKAQEDFEGNPRDELRTPANKANAELIETNNRETQYWKQKAHIKWMELGDQSTSYFHSYVTGRRSALKITSILDGNGKKTLELYIKIGFHLHSQCPLCKSWETNVNHTLLHCEFSINIWNFFANLLQGPRAREGITLRQHFLEWGLRANSKTQRGNLRMVIPGIIAWNIWKIYSAAIYNEDSPAMSTALKGIKTTIQQWNWLHRKKSWMIRDQELYDLGFEIFSLSGKYLHVDKIGIHSTHSIKRRGVNCDFTEGISP